MSEAAKLGKPDIPVTLILDIDGTVLEHRGDLSSILKCRPSETKGTRRKLDGAMADGHKIILITGRPESARDITVAQLAEVGIVYHQLVMDVGHGARIMINDESESPARRGPTAVGITVKRNLGLEKLDIRSGRMLE